MPNRPERPPLTGRQARILALAGAGLSADQVADCCSISAETVRKQLARARRVTGAGTTAEAWRIARARGWLDP